jgi:hypothetical protein
MARALCILDRAEQRRVEFSLTMVNTAFSKDIMKDRATTFNISDIFNSSKEIRNHLPSVSSTVNINGEREQFYRLRTV